MSLAEEPRDDLLRAVLHSLLESRKYRIPAYLFMFLGALLSVFIERPPSMDSAVELPYAVLWSITFAIASGGCLFGTVTDHWEFEYYLIWPLIGTFGIFALAIFLQVIPLGPGVLATAFTMLGLSTMFFARWRDVHKIAKVVNKLASERD